MYSKLWIHAFTIGFSCGLNYTKWDSIVLTSFFLSKLILTILTQTVSGSELLTVESSDITKVNRKTMIRN